MGWGGERVGVGALVNLPCSVTTGYMRKQIKDVS